MAIVSILGYLDSTGEPKVELSFHPPADEQEKKLVQEMDGTSASFDAAKALIHAWTAEPEGLVAALEQPDKFNDTPNTD